MKSFFAILAACLALTGLAAADAVNTKCPLSGKDVDAAQKSDVSVNIGLCCEKCQAKFSGDAKMKLEAVKKYVGSTEKPAHKECPISSKPAKAETAADAKITVAFCCEKCKAEFDKDPKKQMAKVK